MRASFLCCDHCGREAKIVRAEDHVILRSRQSGTRKLDLCRQHLDPLLALFRNTAPTSAGASAPTKSIPYRVVGVTTQPPPRRSTMARQVSWQAKILEFLHANTEPKAQAEIMKALGGNRDVIHTSLSRLEKKGAVRRAGTGLWVIGKPHAAP